MDVFYGNYHDPVACHNSRENVENSLVNKAQVIYENSIRFHFSLLTVYNLSQCVLIMAFFLYFLSYTNKPDLLLFTQTSLFILVSASAFVLLYSCASCMEL